MGVSLLVAYKGPQGQVLTAHGPRLVLVGFPVPRLYPLRCFSTLLRKIWALGVGSFCILAFSVDKSNLPRMAITLSGTSLKRIHSITVFALPRRQ